MSEKRRNSRLAELLADPGVRESIDRLVERANQPERVALYRAIGEVVWRRDLSRALIEVHAAELPVSVREEFRALAGSFASGAFEDVHRDMLDERVYEALGAYAAAVHGNDADGKESAERILEVLPEPLHEEFRSLVPGVDIVADILKRGAAAG